MLLAQIAIDDQERPTLRTTDSFDFELPLPEFVQLDGLHPETWMLGPMIGRNLLMQHLFTRMRCTAPHFRLATIEGEYGSGRMLVAQTLHRIGPAAAGPFAPCVAADFLNDAQALWKDALAGLLYLSRVDELSPEQQGRLRDFLERVAHERIRTRAAAGPLQLVTGSSQPLRHLAANGSFRSDVASHLTAIRFAIPPLRDRREDIPLLAGLFLRHWSQQHGKPLRGFAPGTLSRLIAYLWPGNARELESVVAAAALDCIGQWIRPIDIPRLHWTSPIALPGSIDSEDPDLDHAILRHITRLLATGSSAPLAGSCPR